MLYWTIFITGTFLSSVVAVLVHERSTGIIVGRIRCNPKAAGALIAFGGIVITAAIARIDSANDIRSLKDVIRHQGARFANMMALPQDQLRQAIVRTQADLIEQLAKRDGAFAQEVAGSTGTLPLSGGKPGNARLVATRVGNGTMPVNAGIGANLTSKTRREKRPKFDRPEERLPDSATKSSPDDALVAGKAPPTTNGEGPVITPAWIYRQPTTASRQETGTPEVVTSTWEPTTVDMMSPTEDNVASTVETSKLRTLHFLLSGSDGNGELSLLDILQGQWNGIVTGNGVNGSFRMSVSQNRFLSWTMVDNRTSEVTSNGGYFLAKPDGTTGRFTLWLQGTSVREPQPVLTGCDLWASATENGVIFRLNASDANGRVQLYLTKLSDAATLEQLIGDQEQE